MDFDEFKYRVKSGIDGGIINLTEPLSDLDMAVQFAIGVIQDERGIECEVSVSEIAEVILTFADDGIFNRNTGWFYENTPQEPRERSCGAKGARHGSM